MGSAGETILAASSSTVPVIVHPGSFPAGLFSELQNIPLALPGPSAGGSAAGAGAAAGTASGDLTAVITFLGLFAAGALTAIGAGDDDTSTTSTTTHH